MKKFMKVFACGALAVALTCSLGTKAFAASHAEYTKNENVYVRLGQDGEVSGAYVVNTFYVERSGEITDYGDYDRVMNLTNLEEIESSRGEQIFTADKGRFSYQGDIERAELPWLFDITYLLDGRKADRDELAGADGNLVIRLNIHENPAFADSVFSQSYMLQVSFTLDPDLCDNIRAEGATISDAGAKENVTFIVMPQANEGIADTELTITAEVENFEMDDISINASAMTEVPSSFASHENANIGKTMFIISAEGVTIPEQIKEEVPEEEPSFWEKLFDLFSGLFN